MNEWFKKNVGTIKEKWGKWSLVQKLICGAILLAVVAAVVLLARVSSKPSTVRLFNSPITDESQRESIITRLDSDNVKSYVDADGYISVEDEKTARKWRSKLVAEGFEPSRKDPWSLFDTAKWTRNDFDDKVNWKRAMEDSVKAHIEQLDGIRSANVILTLPDESLFSENQKPTTASVTIFANDPDILSSRRQVKGIQRLISRSVEGLSEDSITIVNGETGEEVNDFAGMEASDRLSLIEKQEKAIRKLESEYSSQVLKQLQTTFGDKRVKVTNMTIEMDMSEETFTSKEYSGITIKPDNPDTVYDDSETVHSLVISEETVDKDFRGTGYNPEGPAGVEGQNPPVYSDMSNVIGKSTESGVKRNYALNEKNISGTKSPEKGRRTISVNIDGIWNYPLYDENGKLKLSKTGGYEREYVPISDEELEKVTKLVQGAIGYNVQRGDSVTVTNIQFDRTDQFREEDAAYIKAQQTKKTIFFVLLGIAVVLIIFIAFRLISREIERRRRLREEELLRRQQAEREQAIWDAKNEDISVTMSVEERRRAELQENAIAMAKEHPEDVAMLIRTWLREEA